MSAKHTPGPWEVRHFNGVGVFAVNNPAGNDSTNYPIVDFGNVGGTRLPEFAHYGTPEANALLLAAAPDSHEANKLSLTVLCAIRAAGVLSHDHGLLWDLDSAIDANRAAIAAATGEPA